MKRILARNITMNGLNLNGQDAVSQPLMADDYQMNMVIDF
jgi:hypothetical protein